MPVFVTVRSGGQRNEYDGLGMTAVLFNVNEGARWGVGAHRSHCVHNRHA
jgi:hypothetical protein